MRQHMITHIECACYLAQPGHTETEPPIAFILEDRVSSTSVGHPEDICQTMP